MRAIIIDPFRNSVLETDIDGSAASIAEALGCDSLQAAHEFETGDILYVDEDAMSKGQAALEGRDDEERAHAFDVGASRSFLGRGVILGAEDGRGRHTDAAMPASRLASIVFLAPKFSDRDGMSPT